MSEEVEEACSDSLTAGVSMDVQEVDEDSGDKLCRFFGEEGATIPAKKAKTTPDDIVKGLDTCHKFVEKHVVIKNKFIREVIQTPLPIRLNQPKFYKKNLKRWIKKEPE